MAFIGLAAVILATSSLKVLLSVTTTVLAVIILTIVDFSNQLQ
jgi:hypothetical protein